MTFVSRLLVTSVLCFVAAASIGTVLPEDSALKPAAPVVRPLNDGLENWLSEHTEKIPPGKLSESELKTQLIQHDEVTRALIELRLGNTTNRSNQEALKFAKDLLQNRTNRLQVLKHPLFPYLLHEFIKTKGLSTDEKDQGIKLLLAYGGRSCPKKEIFLDELNRTPGTNLSVKDFERLLAMLTEFQSKKFRKDALSSFLDTLPQVHQAAFRTQLINLVMPFPGILEDNKWLVDKEDESAKSILEPFKTLRQAEQEAEAGHCRTAKLALLKGATFDKERIAFDKVEHAARKTESCFRRKSNAAREKFWNQIQQGLVSSYGFKGKELAQRNLGLLAWSRDDFQRARIIFTELISEAKSNKEFDLLAESLYTLARIEENDNQIDRSLAYYEDFVTRFPASARHLEALQAMVLLNSIKGDFEQSLKSADKIVNSQTKLKIDDQDAGALSFGLFWAGRLNYTLGRKDTARKMWRRVASEFYSTFYGALGHFVLEKLHGKHLELEPNAGRKATISTFLNSFNDQEKAVLETSSALLKVGMQEEAACELAEVVIEDNGKEKILVKSLFQHAAGEWLSSIINYSGLPRSFRHTLPVGFERILFPRAYVEEVNNYTERLKLDPDLVFAIIRQESVFNPNAISGAGARGLMQLMPGTARLESRQLGQAYLSKTDRAKLQESALSRDKLFEADTNLALGVHHVHRLLQKYGNPIYVLTSYNANPRATERWVQNIKTDDYLTFIERIPYRETQSYVKLVFRNYFYYKRWYRPPTSELPHFNSMAESMMTMASGGKPINANN